MSVNRFDEFRRKLMLFMYGRYGADDFYKFLVILWLLLTAVNIFLRSRILGSVTVLLIVYIYFRVLSKNTVQRARENDIYLKISAPLRSFFRITALRFRDRKTHSYRKCPSCGKMLRLPKRKGKHSVCCPQCKKNFNVKI